ncbi:MAG: hypothetical protein C4320_04910, partial [Armatimonadota bacterium]
MFPLAAYIPLADPPSSPATSGRILLIPLDSRPAATQFPAMIAAMAATDVRVPPYDTLGRFTRPGTPDRILDWLERQPMGGVDAIVASADMVAYGGLIASRVEGTTQAKAVERLERLLRIKRMNAPKVPLFVFASTMRLAPTATFASASYRMDLTKYEEARSRYFRGGEPKLLPLIAKLRAKVPPERAAEYERVRARNERVEGALIRMATRPEISYLTIGQDDAKPDGPHIQETARLRALAKLLSLQEKVFFCEGIDQHANVLVSRALLKAKAWSPRVRVVYSDEDGKLRFAKYESKTIEASLADQLEASGATLAGPGEGYDYSLYLNVPKPRPAQFEPWLASLCEEADQGFPVAVADINFTADGTSDQRVHEAALQNGRAMRLLAYAGWNTAGNTMGTAIPAANVYLFARKFGADPLRREVAQREFLLHRLADDYDFHRFTRPEAYRMLDRLQGQRDEAYGAVFQQVDAFVRRDL